MNITTTPHDALFKKFLTDPVVALDFMEVHLPEHIRKLCDLSTLHFENASFIEEHLQQQSADVKIPNVDYEAAFR